MPEDRPYTTRFDMSGYDTLVLVKGGSVVARIIVVPQKHTRGAPDFWSVDVAPPEGGYVHDSFPWVEKTDGHRTWQTHGKGRVADSNEDVRAITLILPDIAEQEPPA